MLELELNNSYRNCCNIEKRKGVSVLSFRQETYWLLHSHYGQARYNYSRLHFVLLQSASICCVNTAYFYKVNQSQLLRSGSWYCVKFLGHCDVDLTQKYK